MSDSIAKKPAEADYTSTPSQAPTDAVAPSPPELVEFEILKLIGQGTFGSVWLGKERVTGVYRAIKVFPKTSRSTEIAGLCEYQRRAMNHPHLIQIFLVGLYNNTYYVVMELADDIKGSAAFDPQFYEPSSLDRLLKDRGALSVNETLHNLHGIIQATDYLHRQGLVHRDIKPSNVLLVNGKVKLCDFGLIAPGHQAVERAGTHGYWRPDGPTNRESDLYAATKVAYQMFTGSEVSSFPEMPSDLARLTSPTIFRGIKELLEKGCAQHSARRFTSAQAMLNHVERLYKPPSDQAFPPKRTKDSALQRISTPVFIFALLGMFFVVGWFATHWPASAFNPLAQLHVTTYPEGEGNPNPLARDDPQGLLDKFSRVISISNPKPPNRPIRFAKVKLVSKPASYVLVFWISPSGYVYMSASESSQKTYHDPELLAFRNLDGTNSDYVICAFLNDRPFKDKNDLREAIEKLVRNYRDERTEEPLPQRVIRVLDANNLKLVERPGVETDESLQSDFGLLGEIWENYRSSYTIVGVELPLPPSRPAPQPDDTPAIVIESGTDS